MEVLDSDEIDWEGLNDPESPRNWPTRKKTATVAIVSVMAFEAPLSSSMLAPGVPQLMKEFGSANLQLATFVVAVYVLGLAVGPLLLGPMSEIHGRSIIYKLASIFFFAFMIACAVAPSLPTLIIFRFFSGYAGAVAGTNGGGTVADLYVEEERGLAMALLGMGTLIGPCIGPILGGFVTQSLGWRWNFWLLAIISGLTALFICICLHETYPDRILQDKTKRLRKSTGNPLLQPRGKSKAPPTAIFLRAISRPTKLLVLSPVVLGLSLYLAVIYGEVYILFTTYPEVFQQQYQFAPDAVGLSYLGLGAGLILGVGIVARFSDKILRGMTAKHGGSKPEFRLMLLIYGAPAAPIGLFIYGWTADKGIHWIVPIFATSFVGFGLVVTFLPVNLYIVDAFNTYAASALAATSLLRNLAGGLLPLAGLSIYQTLGLGWGNSLLGLLTVAFIVLPVAVYRVGENLRTRFSVNL